MQFTFTRGMRPAEVKRLGVDFTLDLTVTGDAPSGASSITAATEATPGTDLTSTCVSALLLTGNVLTALVTAVPAGQVLVVTYTLHTAAGENLIHSIRIPGSVSA